VIESYKAKEQSYQERLEAAEIARAKAARGEAFGSFSLSVHVSTFFKIRAQLVERLSTLKNCKRRQSQSARLPMIAYELRKFAFEN
jgi:hypothetical protein